MIKLHIVSMGLSSEFHAITGLEVIYSERNIVGNVDNSDWKIIYLTPLPFSLHFLQQLQELLEYMPGPDFPTGGIIMGNIG